MTTINVAADEYLYCGTVPRNDEMEMVKFHIYNLIKNYENCKNTARNIKNWNIPYSYADAAIEISIDHILDHLTKKFKSLTELENNGSFQEKTRI